LAEYRLFRGWSESELRARLVAMQSLDRNFEEVGFEEMTDFRGWRSYGSRALVGREAPGPPLDDGPFRLGCEAIANYRFSDPTIVAGHFDPGVPLGGRVMALEIKVLGLHYLCGVVVGDTRSEHHDTRSVFGFRYDTLRGHIEAGAEWFLLTKDHETGEIRFRVHARWREGQFPNWWSRVGFALLAHRYQRRWHRRAHRRLETLMRNPDTGARPRRRRLAREGPDVVFYYGELREE
jgi:uncharacterized protein (UPF0548 family)